MRKEFSKDNITITLETIGAELKSFICENQEYIWCSDAKYWRRSAPILFPIVGTLKDKKTIINGHVYQIMQHGFLRDMEFEYLGEIDGQFVFQNQYSEETLKLYPFKYQATIKYQIFGKAVKTTFEIENIDDVTMPMNIGGHPAINCPLNQGDQFSDYKIIFSESETFASPKVMSDATLNFDCPVLEYQNLKELPLEKALFDIDTIIITKIKSRELKLVNKEHKGIKFSFDNFTTLAIWTPNNEAPFICLEPWQGYNDHHNTDGMYLKKDDIVLLEKQEKYLCSYTIEVL